MGDLFHEDVPEEYIWQVIEIAWEAKEHTFQILTKRPERMLEVLTRSMWWLNDTPRNIWLGVTAENQQAADERREYLRHCPAAIKYVSYEPAIGPIDWTGWEFVDWVISGGESGSRARPSHPDWHRDTRDFCQRNGIAYFFKQWGAWAPTRPLDREEWVKRGGAPEHKEHHPWEFDRVGKKRAGRLLDGREWSQYPEA
jgi:protein gp37